MANRRMFSKRIINSARFLKMPISTQCLYFHLGMNADDDGIVEAYNVMNSVCGVSEDDLRVLTAKQFVEVLNEDLVTYIKDWRENNSIRADRKVDSIYKDLVLQMLPSVELLESKKNNTIVNDNQMTTNCQPNDNQMTTNCQHRLGKDNISKDNISKDNLEVSEVINSLNQNFGEELVQEAIKIADKRNVLEIPYIIGILTSWKKRGYKTVEDTLKERPMTEQITALYEN